MKISTWIVLTAVVAAGCASSPGEQPAEAGQADVASSAALDPVGTYSFTTAVEGTSVNGRFHIAGAPGAWTGTMYTDVTGQLPLSSVDVDGDQLMLTAQSPEGTIQVSLQFSGDTFTGDWWLGSDGGSITGRRTGR